MEHQHFIEFRPLALFDPTATAIYMLSGGVDAAVTTPCSWRKRLSYCLDRLDTAGDKTFIDPDQHQEQTPVAVEVHLSTSRG